MSYDKADIQNNITKGYNDWFNSAQNDSIVDLCKNLDSKSIEMKNVQTITFWK